MKTTGIRTLKNHKLLYSETRCKLTINYLLLLTVLFHNTAYSRQDTMLINDSIISLINELNNIKDKNITQLENIFGCKF